METLTHKYGFVITCAYFAWLNKDPHVNGGEKDWDMDKFQFNNYFTVSTNVPIHIGKFLIPMNKCTVFESWIFWGEST